MNTKLTTLKTELRDFIELSKTITPGKWQQGDSAQEINMDMCYRQPNKFGQSAGISVYGRNSGISREQDYLDCSFIARSRNISPAMAECLLVAVDAIILIRSASPTLDWHDEKCNLALQQILNIWEAAK